MICQANVKVNDKLLLKTNKRDTNKISLSMKTLVFECITINIIVKIKNSNWIREWLSVTAWLHKTTEVAIYNLLFLFIVKTAL